MAFFSARDRLTRARHGISEARAYHTPRGALCEAELLRVPSRTCMIMPLCKHECEDRALGSERWLFAMLLNLYFSHEEPIPMTAIQREDERLDGPLDTTDIIFSSSSTLTVPASGYFQ